jgi:PAS domain S-box-containing protein
MRTEDSEQTSPGQQHWLGRFARDVLLSLTLLTLCGMTGASALAQGTGVSYGTFALSALALALFAAHLWRRQAQSQIRDFSETRQMELTLRESEQRLVRTFELMPESIAVTDHNGVYLEVNRHWTQTFGWTRAEALGKRPTDLGLWAEESAPKALTEAFARQGRVSRFECLIRNKSGALLNIELTGEALGGEAMGQAIWIARDVTAQRLAEAERKQAQQELSAAQERMLKAFEGLPNPLSMSDAATGRLVYVNQAWQDKLGYRSDEVLGRTATELNLWHNPEDRKQALALLAANAPGKRAVFRFRDRLGRVLLHECTVRQMQVGEQNLHLWAARDATEETQAIEALHVNEARLSALFEASPAALAVSRCEDHQVLDVNPAWCALFRISASALVGRPAHGFVPGDPDDSYAPLQAELLEHGQVNEAAVAFSWPGGEHRHALMSGRQVFIQGELCALWMAVDITEHLHAEQARARSEQRFEALFRDAPQPLAVSGLDPKFSTLDFNDTWYREFGYSKSQALGAPGTQYGLWAHPEQRMPMLEAARRKGFQQGEVELVRANGEHRTIALSLRVVGEGEDAVMLCVYDDITEHRAAQQQLEALNATLEQRVAQRTEELQRTNEELSQAIEHLHSTRDELVRAEKMAALGKLVAGIAHELNTPIGNAVLIASTLQTQEQALQAQMSAGLTRSALNSFMGNVREACLILDRNLQRAAELIAGFKQVAADQTSYQRRPFDLHIALQEVLLALSPSLRQAHVKVIETVPAGVMLDSYPGPLGQVLINLINNAMLHAFGDRKDGQLTVSLAPSEAGWVCLLISDNGCGVPAAHLARLFDPFFTTRLGQGGSGLGLNIVYNLVTGLLGGRIRVHSEPDQGTHFQIDLPLQAPQADSAAV